MARTSVDRRVPKSPVSAVVAPSAIWTRPYVDGLKMLARRELSEQQVRQRLARKGHDADAIDDADRAAARRARARRCARGRSDRADGDRHPQARQDARADADRARRHRQGDREAGDRRSRSTAIDDERAARSVAGRSGCAGARRSPTTASSSGSTAISSARASSPIRRLNALSRRRARTMSLVSAVRLCVAGCPGRPRRGAAGAGPTLRPDHSPRHDRRRHRLAGSIRRDVGIHNGHIARIGDLGNDARGGGDRRRPACSSRPASSTSTATRRPPRWPTAENMLTQGVTTEILNPDGGGTVDMTQQLTRAPAPAGSRSTSAPTSGSTASGRR